MKISKSELVQLNACSGGLKRFIKQTNGVEDSVEVVSLIGGENTVSDLLWLAGKKLPVNKIVKFACQCAVLNIEKIKPYCSENDYTLICDFLDGPSSADAAADAAAAAADAADAAAADAADAADAAIYAARAARAADAAIYAADAADAARAADAADAAQINELLVELFTE